MKNNFDNIDSNKLLSFLIEGKIVPKDVLPSSNKVLESEEIIEAILSGSELVSDSLNDSLY